MRTHARLSRLATGNAWSRLSFFMMAGVALSGSACRSGTEPEGEAPKQYSILVSPTGDGAGYVLGSWGIACYFHSGICTGTCSATLPVNTIVTLTAQGDAGVAVAHWAEGATVLTTGPTVTFTVTANRTLSPHFSIENPSPYTVTGVVVDSLSGAPVAGATVTIGGRGARADTLGHYVMVGLAAGTYTIAVASMKHRPFAAPLVLKGTVANLAHDIRLIRTWPWVETVVVDSPWNWYYGRTLVTWVDLDGDFPETAAGVSIDCTSPSGESPSYIAYETIAPNARKYTFAGCLGSPTITARMTDEAGHRASFTCTPTWGCKEL